MEFADSLCTLQRSFGRPGEEVILGFKPGTASEHMRVMVIRKGKDKKTNRGDATITFDGAAPVKAGFVEGYVEKNGVRVALIDLKDADLAPLPAARQMRIQAGALDIILVQTAVPAALKTLKGCEKDLLVRWGMDPKTVDSIAKFPQFAKPLFVDWDYPSEAVRKKQQGTTGARFWVSREGVARDCIVVESSGSQILDSQTCTIIAKRGRFEPARTVNGEAVESVNFTRVRWILPER